MSDPANSYDKDTYFANLKPTELAQCMDGKVETFGKYLSASGRLSVWSRSYNYYNQGIYKDARLNRVGAQGEYTEMYVNHFRNLLTHILNMTTGQRPSFDAKAVNTDFASLAQTIIANGVVEYYNRYKKMGTVAKRAVEDFLVFADGYVYQGWDFSLGNPVAPDMSTGKIQKEGDVTHKNFTPLDVIFDHVGGLLDANRQWYCIRDYQNRWDLIARYPEMKDQIMTAASDAKTWNMLRTGPIVGDDSNDMVPVYIFMHDRTDAVPDGRYFVFLSSDCWLLDSKLPPFYKTLPLKRLCASEQRGTGFGYSVGFDMAPICEALNGLYSTIITNQKTFGVQNILMPSGANISVAELVDGLNLITYDAKAGKPEGLNLTSTPAEIFDFIARLETILEVLSGVNSVARGQPEDSLKSGSALALVQSMAVQFMSGLQEAYGIFLEDLATGLIEILQSQASTPRLIQISGKNNKSYMKQFTAKEIGSISRVTVDMGNPLARTTAGKVSMAQDLMKMGMIETPEQYFQVLTTGRLEPLFEGKQAEIMNIKAENEALSSGLAFVVPEGQDYMTLVQQTPGLEKTVPVIALLVDNHPMHVREHKAVLADPEMRKNPLIVKATLQHIFDHIKKWTECPPQLIQMLKEEFPAMPAPPPGGEGDASGSAEQMVPGNPTNKKASKVRPAKMPKNPATGQPAPTTGGV